MNAKKIIPVIIAIIAISAVAMFLTSTDSKPKTVEGFDFKYSDMNTLRNTLSSKSIFMSTPTQISDYTVKQYCMYFDENNSQKVMNQCLTSAITDSNGNALGNINIGGDANSPQMVLALIETPELDSQDIINLVFETMIQIFVCDCWAEKQPGGYDTMSQWLDAAQNYYVETGKETTKSTISGLAGKQLILEITKTNDTYLWTLIIVK